MIILLLSLALTKAEGNLRIDTLSTNVLGKAEIPLFDKTIYKPIVQEGHSYFHPARWKQGIIVMSEEYQALNNSFGFSRVMSYSDLEYMDFLRMVALGELPRDVEGQLTRFLYDFFAGRVARGESYNSRKPITGNNLLDQRIMLFAAFDRRDLASVPIHLQAYLEKDPNSLAAHSLDGGIAYAMKNWKSANESFSKTIRIDPEYAYGYFFRALARIELGMEEEAEMDLLKSFELFPDSPVVANRLGFFYQEEARFEEAIQVYRKAIEMSPRNYMLYDATGYCFKQLNLPDSALLYLEKAQEISPGNPDTYLMMGEIYYWKKEYRVADYLFTKTIELDPFGFTGYAYRADSYLMQGKYDLALLDYQRAAEIDSTKYFVLSGMGSCYFYKEEYNKAIPYFERVVGKDPDQFDAYSYLGWCYIHTNQLISARSAFEKCLQIRPVDTDILTNLGWLCYELGDFQSCYAYSKEAYTMDNSRYIAKFNAALSVLRLGQIEKSYAMYLQFKNEHQDQDLSGIASDLQSLLDQGIMIKEARYILRKILQVN
ncbi:MAG: tetratricopeptide repeat protein [Bacteroidota bacterium]